MNGASFALSILGLDKTELLFCNILLDLTTQYKYGEIPGKQIRGLLDLNKETLFALIKSLEETNVLIKTFSEPHLPAKAIYIMAGDGRYCYNYHEDTWKPKSDSIFYKICKEQNLRTTGESYQYILENFNIFEEVNKTKVKDESLKTYGLYEHFCKQYKSIFGQAYKTKNVNRDLVHAKNILFEARMKGMKDGQIKDFIDWAVRTERSDIIMGFLPIRLNEYFVKNKVTLYGDKTILDENGHLKAIS